MLYGGGKHEQKIRLPGIGLAPFCGEREKPVFEPVLMGGSPKTATILNRSRNKHPAVPDVLYYSKRRGVIYGDFHNLALVRDC